MAWNFDRRLEETTGWEGSLGALATMLPEDLLQEALEASEKSDKRVRKLPLRVVTWLVVGMSLYRGLSVKNTLRRLVDGLGLAVSWGRSEVPHTTSISHARDRLGWEAVRELFRRLVQALHVRFSSADRWKDLAVYVIDGTCLRAADTDENEAEFGRPGTGRGRSAFPQFRGVLLMGAWSHLVLGGLFGSWRMGELTLARHLLPQIPARALVLVDRLYFAYAWLADLAAEDRFFVVRAKAGKTVMKVTKFKKVGRNEWRGNLRIPPSLRKGKKKRTDLPEEIEVRVIRIRRKGFRDVELVTNLLSTEDYPADEIVALYMDRWEVELGIREMKCVLNGNSTPTFRSHKPDRVKQEAYGLLVAYNCVRALMAEAAEQQLIEARRLSFTNCLEQIQVFLFAMHHAGEEHLPRLYEAMLDAMAACRLPKRRSGRTCPREVRIKLSKYKKKWKAA
jgi:hypothetical protein